MYSNVIVMTPNISKERFYLLLAAGVLAAIVLPLADSAALRELQIIVRLLGCWYTAVLAYAFASASDTMFESTQSQLDQIEQRVCAIHELVSKDELDQIDQVLAPFERDR